MILGKKDLTNELKYIIFKAERFAYGTIRFKDY